MADDEAPQQVAASQENLGSVTGRFVAKLFAKKDGEMADGEKAPKPQQGVAQIPSTVLTVEYVDDSEGMDSAIREMADRLRKLEERTAAIQETQTRVVAALNQQAKDIGKIVESLSRRIDRLYKRLTGADLDTPSHHGIAAEVPVPAEPVETVPAADDDGGYAGPVGGISPSVADDPDHQNAWRIARVLAADLEGYHGDDVREGVLYGTFYSVLREPIEKARKTYEQRVAKDIVEGYDYFSKALDELIVRKRMELEEEGAF